MKLLRVGLVLVIFALFCAPSAHAIDTGSFTPKPDLPLLITGYSFAGSRLNYVQLYNPSDMPVDMTGWHVQYTVDGQTTPVEIASLSGLIKPHNYIVLGEEAEVPTADFMYHVETGGVAGSVNGIKITSPDFADYALALKYDTKCPYPKESSNFWKRHISDSTGNYTSTFDCFLPDNSYVLYAAGLYDYPEAVPLRVSEVLAHPRDCSPLDTRFDCGDYVKIYNPSSDPINLDGLRLRTGYQGQGATSSNTYLLSGTILPGHYGVITKDASGQSLSITNSGGFIWLEDMYGLKRYDNTVQEYADASADSKQGQAWAYDASDNTWKWTTQPAPVDGPSVFPAPVSATVSAHVSSVLVPCKAGQYRSEETNRCRSVASVATANLTPCRADQERNPETNRCRNIATTASALTPCKEGQERNPDTNRCRNVTKNAPSAAFAVEPIKDTGTAFAGWWALGGVGMVAGGYGIWEWRREMLTGIQKVGSFLIGRK